MHFEVNQYFQPFTPKELDIKEKADQRPFPWLPFLSIMLAQYALIFAIVWSDADFGLFLSLAGAVSGSTVVMIFPASFWLHIDGWKLMQSKTKFKNAFCYFSKFKHNFEIQEPYIFKQFVISYYSAIFQNCNSISRL